jgi:glycosyltransferase involved in cell wall biosynthesis
MPKITVGLLTYNRKQYLERSVRSILRQDFTDFEFILVDNGSTDGSAMLCDSFAREDNRVYVIHKERGNIGSGRNAVVLHASASYVAFIDDDDYAEPDMLSFLYDLVIQNDVDISFCGSTREANGAVEPNCVFNTCKVFTPQEAVEKLLGRKLLNAATPTKLFSKAILDAYPFSEDVHYEDIFITYKLFASARRVVGYGLPKYCFVRHLTNNSSFTDNKLLLSPEQLEEYFAAYRERTVWLIERFPGMSEVVVYSEWSFLISMYHKIMSGGNECCDSQLKYIKNILIKCLDNFERSPYCKPFEREWLRLYFSK